MAKLVFGVCGVGVGHAMRMRVILEKLEKKHDILIIASLFPSTYLKKYFKNKVVEIEGLEIAFKNNTIVNYRTVLKNLKKLSLKNYSKLKEVKRIVERFDPDIIFSDMEPFVCVLAKEMKKPLVSIGNQHYTLFGDFNVKSRDYINYMTAVGVIKTLVPSPDYSVITYFEGTKLKKDPRRFLTLPIIRKEILEAKASVKDYVLVYQSITSYSRLIKMLENINEKFVIYGHDMNKKRKNLTFKKFDDSKKFIEDLKNCKAVITNAGFTLLSESLILNKPILAIPIKKHFEQKLNAIYIKENKYGDYYSNLNITNIKKFLDNLTNYKRYKAKQKNNEKVIEVIEKIIKNVA